MAEKDRKKKGGRAAVEERDEQAFEGSIAPTGPGRGETGAPSAGTQVFSCDRCTARFTDYHELMKHQSEAHGM